MRQMQVTGETCRIVVGSGKGGVGKSVVSVMLAAVAAERGRTVLLLDGEQNLANLHVLLGVGSRDSIESVLGGRVRAEELVQPVAPHLWLLPAESGSEGLYALDAVERARLHCRLVGLSQQYEVVVVDAGAGIEGVVRAATLGADRILLVTAPEPTALMDAHALVKMLSLQVPYVRIDVFVNRCAGEDEGKGAFVRLAAASEQFLNRRLHLAGILLEERQVAVAVREPRHFLARLMETRAAQCIREARLDVLDLIEPTRSRA
ncbi:MAG: AAA family ATPase [Gemmatimonadales bacterium]|nr:AAA family ATPase [Gemmatimonadales bacterium]